MSPPPASDLPDYFFRIRENGAAVFRVGDEDRNRRLDMRQIAVVNTRNGEVKPQGGQTLTEADRSAIATWLADRQAELARREADQVHRTIEALNLTAQWAQSKADAETLETLTEPLLLAMHDLRSVLIRKKTDRLQAVAAAAQASG